MIAAQRASDAKPDIASGRRIYRHARCPCRHGSKRPQGRWRSTCWSCKAARSSRSIAGCRLSRSPAGRDAQESSDRKGLAQSPHRRREAGTKRAAAARRSKRDSMWPSVRLPRERVSRFDADAGRRPLARSDRSHDHDETDGTPRRLTRGHRDDTTYPRPSVPRPACSPAARGAVFARRRVAPERGPRGLAPPAASPLRAPVRRTRREGITHEAHVVQRHPGRRAAGGDRRWPEALRPRHRVRLARNRGSPTSTRPSSPASSRRSKPASSITAPSATASCRSRKSPAQYLARRRTTRPAVSPSSCAKARS